MDSDSWQPADPDYWKDDDQKVRETIRFLHELLEKMFALIPRERLLQLRENSRSQPHLSHLVGLIDEHLERRFGPADEPPRDFTSGD